MPAGRPTVYDPSYCDVALEKLSQGYSIEAVAATIGVCRDTILEWTYVHPEFSGAVKRGKALSAMWWETVLMDVARNGGGNATATIFGVKNRSHEWKDKTETQNTNLNAKIGPEMEPEDEDDLLETLDRIEARKRAEV